jgi:hypothetical protein
MVYALGPYALYPSLPVPERPKLYSAREINPATGRYVNDATTGGFESMPSIAQRVLLLVSFGVKRSKFITPQNMEQERKDCIRALEPLTTLPSPSINLLLVSVERVAAGKTKRIIKYRNLITGLDEEVQT